MPCITAYRKQIFIFVSVVTKGCYKLLAFSIHSFSFLSHDRSIFSSKASSSKNVVLCFLFQFPLPCLFLRVIHLLLTSYSSSSSHCVQNPFLFIHINTMVGTLIVATIYLQLIQNRYMFLSFTVLHCSHQQCVQPVASDVEVVGYLLVRMERSTA